MGQYYNNTYFLWQKKAGEYGGMQDVWKFAPFIKKTDMVLDFGCGGGYILEKIHCKKKYGIDINQNARYEAEQKGIVVFERIEEISSSLKFDVIFSHHTLEHVENPAQILKLLRTHLKKGGVSIHVVPVDDWRKEKIYNSNDINKHLYTWTPLLIGNLFIHCGYRIKVITIAPYQWLPLSRYYYGYIPKFLYYSLCHIWGFILNIREVSIVVTV